MSRLIEWFIPDEIRSGRTDSALARVFVFTHIFGPLIAQPMWIYLYIVDREPDLSLFVLAAAICSFWLMPFLLRATGNIHLAALVSFQALATTSLYGAYHYGGFSSPFLPWLVVSLLLGLFYLSKSIRLVLAIFLLDFVVFISLAWHFRMPEQIPIEKLGILGWLSITSATIYVTWMATYYSRIVGMHAELEAEAERSRITSRELEKARAMAEKNSQSRSRFFSKMSHELRTPLNAIIGYSEILLEDIEADPPQGAAGRAEDVMRINAAGKHLRSLVFDVLDSDTIENEQMRVEPTEFTIGELCDEVMANATPMVEKNDNRFIVICPHRERRLFTDARKLRQVVLNLLSNAGKFTSKGIVKLEFHVEAWAHEDQLRILVTDTGIGIAPDSLSRLFTEYEQGDASVVANYGGTGIGLALSRRFCILLGGNVSVVSRPGHGSSFTVNIPTHLSEDVQSHDADSAVSVAAE